jgi:hypothetical protein
VGWSVAVAGGRNIGAWAEISKETRALAWVGRWPRWDPRLQWSRVVYSNRVGVLPFYWLSGSTLDTATFEQELCQYFGLHYC